VPVSIHNASIFLEPSRATTADGHATTLVVNNLAPYMLTALIGRPARLIYLSSGLHHAGAGIAAGHRLDQPALERRTGVRREQPAEERWRRRQQGDR
jgi:hypothetical protein